MLSNRKALIVGGLGGIGSCLSRALLRNDIQKLAIIDLPENAPSEFTAKNNVSYIQCNMSDKDNLKHTFQTIWDDFAGFDLIINSAGVSNELEPEKTININTLGLINFTLTGAEFMRKDLPTGRGGTIINIVSTLGYLPYQGFPIYVATKHAALGFLKSIAEEQICNETGLNFITICPGYTDTGFVAERSRHPFSMKIQDEPTPPQDPETVAQCLLNALQSQKAHGIWRCVDGTIDEIELLGCKVL